MNRLILKHLFALVLKLCFICVQEGDEPKDVEGVPVITMETDVLMEEVEELDYDEADEVLQSLDALKTV